MILMALDSHKKGSLYNIVATSVVFVLVFGLAKFLTDASTSVSVMFGLVGAMFIYIDSLATTTRDETVERLVTVATGSAQSFSELEKRIVALERRIVDLEKHRNG